MPVLISSAGLETVAERTTWPLWTEQETRTRKWITTLAGQINSDPKWGKRKILWDSLYSHLFLYVLVGNHIKYLKQKELLIVQTLLERSFGLSKKQATMTNRSALYLGQSEYELDTS